MENKKIKKILFVVPNMHMNGANKSLINLLKLADRERFHIDLFLYRHCGILLHEIPAGITLLPEDPCMATFEAPLKEVLAGKNIAAKGIRLLAAVYKKLARQATDVGIKYWLWRTVAPLAEKYDAAIAWCEGSSHRFVLEKVSAKKKVGWCHIDDEAWPYHFKQQKKVFPKLDCICTVSQHCKNVLLRRYGLQPDKVRVIHNIMSVHAMWQEVGEQSPYPDDGVHILTYARNEAFKGVEDAMEAARVLHERGRKIHWWIFGGGFSDEQYERQLPYLSIRRPVLNADHYTKWCDIYVQTSRAGEAWGMGVNEAKIFAHPVVTSNIEVFREQVEDGITGLTYDGTVNGLVTAIERLILEEGLMDQIRTNLQAEDWSNMKDLDLLYSILDSEG